MIPLQSTDPLFERPINEPKTGVLPRVVDEDEARRRQYLLTFSQVCDFWRVGRPPLLPSLKGLLTDHLSHVLRVP